jgi:hypothetical protein
MKVERDTLATQNGVNRQRRKVLINPLSMRLSGERSEESGPEHFQASARFLAAGGSSE